ncbi:MAG: toll/interleukin-1 receptor domain-containing protein, partial [Planctomyces sp.]
MPSALTVYIIHHPQSDDTREVCRRLQQWFRLSDSSGAQSDAGLPVWYRRQVAPLPKVRTTRTSPKTTSLEPRFQFDPVIDWNAALLNVVILLVDQHFVASTEWRQATEHLLAKLNDPDRPPLILPVALHDSFYRLSPLYNNCNPIRLLDQPDPAAATVTLRRLVSEAVSRRLRQTSADQNLPRLNVFLSHAKADGREIAERIRDSISHFSQMDAWYDANELALGGNWQQKIITAAANETAAMITVVTDKYSSRPWCRLEVEAARTPQPLDQSNLQIWKLQPAVAVH